MRVNVKKIVKLKLDSVKSPEAGGRAGAGKRDRAGAGAGNRAGAGGAGGNRAGAGADRFRMSLGMHATCLYIYIYIQWCP